MHESSPRNRMIPADTVTRRIDAPETLDRVRAMIAKHTHDDTTRAAIIADADTRVAAATSALNAPPKWDHGHQALAGVLAYASLAKAIPTALNTMLDRIGE
jgi:hypothetical protein